MSGSRLNARFEGRNRPIVKSQSIVAVAGTAFLALVIGVGVAAAQSSDGSSTLSKPVNLSPKDEVLQADAALGRMDQARRVVSQDLASARQQRDVVKTLCLNDKLTQMDIALRSARERRTELQSAADRNDTDLANHEFTILTVLRQRTEQLGAEANQCMGVGDVIEEGTQVKSEIDKSLPEEDPSEYPTIPVAIEPPSCASCVR